MRLGPIGIWSRQLRYGDPARSSEAAAELDDIGFDALWFPDTGGSALEAAARLLDATRRAVVATGILNIWLHEPVEVATTQHRLGRENHGRFLLGLGVSHAPLMDAREPGRYKRPLEAMRAYLDALDRATPANCDSARVLGALAPKMVQLAGQRGLGVHPYLTPTEHTALVREALGPDRLVAPALSVVLETDRRRAYEIAREDLATYLNLPNYTNTWRRLGFADADLHGGGSNRLVDAIYACGSAEQIAERVSEHRQAGANHVCLRVVFAGDPNVRLPVIEWRELAPAVM